MIIKKGSILTNIMDIHGQIHKKIEVISIYDNTLAVSDLSDFSRWIVHKINVGMKPVGSNPKYQHYHFDLRESQNQKASKQSPVRAKRWAY